jgi:hypothetical protein
VNFDVAQHGRLDSAEGEIEAWMLGVGLLLLRRRICVFAFCMVALVGMVATIAVFDLRGQKFDSVRVTVRREAINDWTAGVAES